MYDLDLASNFVIYSLQIVMVRLITPLGFQNLAYICSGVRGKDVSLSARFAEVKSAVISGLLFPPTHQSSRANCGEIYLRTALQC